MSLVRLQENLKRGRPIDFYMKVSANNVWGVDFLI